MTRNTNNAGPYGTGGMPYGGYVGYPQGQYYLNTSQYPYYPYYHPSVHQSQLISPYMASQCYIRPGNANGYERPQRKPTSRPTERQSTKITCEPCNMVFDRPSELSEHIDELHVSCEVEGCSYSAPLDLMAVHAFKHVKNEKGELVLESPEENRKWIENRRNRHPLNRKRNMAPLEDSTLERLLREAHGKRKSSAPDKSALYPLIHKVKERPSALLQLSDPAKYNNLVRQTFGPYSYRPSLSMGRTLCQTYKRTKACKFGDRCQFSHDLKGGTCKDLCVTKRPPVVLHVLKKDIYSMEKTLISAIKTIVLLNFFDDTEENATVGVGSEINLNQSKD
ncbi:hypothetical protein BgAZ_303190 [Babesia gibsoni]|uniref:C3H1-type domain-containing protein n=1 Tax=Babesia gibsoni TaxID=33632 RepID=A0AAD8PDX1_BABGI|nr:hypothetical protein BgAZ_303190 [Babesia gibsoni]